MPGRWRAPRHCRRKSSRAYRDYQFHVIYQSVHNFCVDDLGGLYLDVIKDRLYTTPADGHARRSAQTAMFHIAEAMVRWLAPILSFTAEEIWQALPGRQAAAKSVFLTTWHEFPAAARVDDRLGRADRAAPGRAARAGEAARGGHDRRAAGGARWMSTAWPTQARQLRVTRR